MDVVFFILLIGPLVFAHELGHFLVAKAFGIRVLKFSLGFGPVMLGRQVGETYYQVAWIPLGGFVKFLGDDPREEVKEEDRGRSFLASARWKRALVVVAGPFMSLLLPVFCYFTAGLLRDELLAPTIGQVIPGSPAEAAGLRAGDRILEVDGQTVYGFEDLQREISSRPNEVLTVVARRGQEELTLSLRPALVTRTQNKVLDITQEVGQIGVHNVFPAPVIGIPDEASPAGQAGLRTFDLVTAFNGRPVKRWIDLERELSRVRPGQEVRIAFLRPQKREWIFGDLYLQEPETVRFVAGEGSDGQAELGIELASLYLSHVRAGMPGAAAGLQVGDKVLTFDGEPLKLWEQLVDQLNKEPNQPHELTVLRQGEVVHARLQLEGRVIRDRYAGEIVDYRPGIGVYRIGVLGEPAPNVNRVQRAAQQAVLETLNMIRFMAVGFLRMVQGRVSLESIGGPIMLFEIAGTAGRQGAHSFLQVLALISVNLGLLNLLPIPVLDGGHLLLLAVEAIRRRTLSQRARELVHIADFSTDSAHGLCAEERYSALLGLGGCDEPLPLSGYHQQGSTVSKDRKDGAPRAQPRQKSGASGKKRRAAPQGKATAAPHEERDLRSASGARRVALEVLLRVQQGGAFAAAALDAELRRRPLSRRDRTLATELALGVLRWRGALDRRLAAASHRPLEKIDPVVRAILHLGSYQLLGPLRIPAYASVAEAVQLARQRRGEGAAAFVNAVLRRLGTNAAPAFEPSEALPSWLFEELTRVYGLSAAQRLAELSTVPSDTCLRIEPRRTSREAALATLERESPQASLSPGRLSPLAIRTRGLGPVPELQSYQSGQISVQEEGAQLCTLLLDVARGQHILDACAGRGGKTTLLASMALGRASLHAADRHPGKLERLQEECRRLGIEGIEPVAVDLLVGTAGLSPPYDRILLDVPCSGTGTLARRPEIRWRLTPEQVNSLAEVQRQLADQCLRLLRPGGVLVYCSCSILPQEGRDQIDRLVRGAGPVGVTTTNVLQLLPHLHGTDGFFAARLVRNA